MVGKCNIDFYKKLKESLNAKERLTFSFLRKGFLI